MAGGDEGAAPRIWRRWFDTEIHDEPASPGLVVAHGIELLAGTYVLSLEPVDGQPSAYRVNGVEEQRPIWNTRLYVFLPLGDGRFERRAFGPGAKNSPEEAFAAFNALPEQDRSFTLADRERLVFHAGFDVRDNEGRMCVVIQQVA